MAAIKGPGDSGSMQGQIKTPMCSENVQNKGDGKVHSYSKATGNPSTSGGGSIKGPGAQGKWDTQISINGDNTGKY